MFGEFAAGIASLKAAGDILKGLNAASTQAAINEAKISLQERVFEAREALAAAQNEQAAALARISELEQEIVRLKDWEAERERYELRDAGRGAFAYMQKSGVNTGEPPHWLCANCFNKRQKSLLQFRGQNQMPGGPRTETSRYGCDSCAGAIIVGYAVNPQTLVAKAASPASGA